MEQQELEAGNRRFGSYLRRVREAKKLSLDAVEELSMTLPGRVTKSHLSRIENGLAVPTFQRLFALSRVYGVPVSTLAERFEVEILRVGTKVEIEGRNEEDVASQASTLKQSGRFSEALALYCALRELREAIDEHDKRAVDYRLWEADCLIHLSRFELARAEVEEILGLAWITDDQRLRALQNFVICCYRLKLYTVALMGLDRAEKEFEAPFAPARLRADLTAIRGNILIITGQASEALHWHTRALTYYEACKEQLEICRAKLNISSVLIELGEDKKAEEYIRAALELAEASGFGRQSAFGLSNLALIAFRRKDYSACEACALRSNALARPREYWTLVFRNCYYLREVSRIRGDDASVKSHERTLRTYLSQVDDSLPEAVSFRLFLKGEGK